MRFEEGDQTGEQGRFTGPAPELVCLDSGQVEEPPRPPLGAKSYSKRTEGKRHRIFWQVIWYPDCHGLE